MKKLLLKVYPAIVTILVFLIGIAITLIVAGYTDTLIVSWSHTLRQIIAGAIGITGTVMVIILSIYTYVRSEEYRDFLSGQ